MNIASDDTAIETPPDARIDAALSQARQALYRFAALTLADPRTGAWHELTDPRCQQVAVAAAALLREEPAAVASKLAIGEKPLERLDVANVLATLPPSPEALNAAYEAVFGLLVSGSCPPYESEYVNSKFTFQRSQTLADVAGFYRAFGMETSDSHPERPDHIVLELEFMGLLVDLERRASAGTDPRAIEHQAVCRAAQAKFLEEHLAWWAPAFARLLAHENPHGFYAAVGEFLAALIAAERALLGLSAPTAATRPTTIERPEECEGCLLQS
jgi:DMSO reductase family type II enzyme chaperone